jgi:hypothetical protein
MSSVISKIYDLPTEKLDLSWKCEKKLIWYILLPSISEKRQPSKAHGGFNSSGSGTSQAGFLVSVAGNVVESKQQVVRGTETHR